MTQNIVDVVWQLIRMMVVSMFSYRRIHTFQETSQGTSTGLDPTHAPVGRVRASEGQNFHLCTSVVFYHLVGECFNWGATLRE